MEKFCGLLKVLKENLLKLKSRMMVVKSRGWLMVCIVLRCVWLQLLCFMKCFWQCVKKCIVLLMVILRIIGVSMRKIMLNFVLIQFMMFMVMIIGSMFGIMVMSLRCSECRFRERRRVMVQKVKVKFLVWFLVRRLLRCCIIGSVLVVCIVMFLGNLFFMNLLRFCLSW